MKLFLLIHLILVSFSAFSQLSIFDLIPEKEKEFIDFSLISDTVYFEDNLKSIYNLTSLYKKPKVSVQDIPKGKYYAYWKKNKRIAITIEVCYLKSKKSRKSEYRHIELEYRSTNNKYVRFSQYFNGIPVNTHANGSSWDSITSRVDYSFGIAPMERFTSKFLSKKGDIAEVLKFDNGICWLEFENILWPKYKLAFKLLQDSSFQFFYERYGKFLEVGCEIREIYNLHQFSGKWNINNGEINFAYDSLPHDSLFLYTPKKMVAINKQIFTEDNGVVVRDAIFKPIKEFIPKDFSIDSSITFSSPSDHLNYAFEKHSDSLLDLYFEEWVKQSKTICESDNKPKTEIQLALSDIMKTFYTSNEVTSWVKKDLVGDDWKITPYAIRDHSFKVTIWDLKDISTYYYNRKYISDYGKDKVGHKTVKVENINCKSGNDSTTILFLNCEYGKAFKEFLKYKEVKIPNQKEYFSWHERSTYPIDMRFYFTNKFNFVRNHLSEDYQKVYFLNNHLSFVHSHDYNSWNIYTHPGVYRVGFNKHKTQAMFSFYLEYNFGEALFKKDNGNWYLEGIDCRGYQ